MPPMKTSFFSLILLVLVLFSACQESKRETLDRVMYVDLENRIKDLDEKAPLSGAIKELTYIPLETDTNSLISRMRRAVLYNNTIVASDFNRVYQFSSSGKFMGTVGQQGEGPSDYRRQVYVLAKNDKEDRFYLGANRKLIIYDEKMSFVNSVSFGAGESNAMPLSGVMTANDHLFSYIGGMGKMASDTTTLYSYLEVDTQGNLVRKLLNTNPMIVGPVIMMINYNIPLYRYGDQTRYMNTNNDTLFTITPQGEIFPYAIFHLGAQRRDTGTLPVNQAEYEIAQAFVEQSGIVESDQLFYLSFSWKQKTYYAIYDKQTGQVTNLGTGGLTNDIDGGPPFFPKAMEKDGTLVSWIEAETFKEHYLSQDYQTQKAIYGKAFEDAWALANRLKEDDNPVLVIAR